MGYANASLIRACEVERKKGSTSEAFKRAAAAVDKSQAECPHPEGDQCVSYGPPVFAKHYGRPWCRRCSKLL
jgi:hypothetical protein